MLSMFIHKYTVSKNTVRLSRKKVELSLGNIGYATTPITRGNHTDWLNVNTQMAKISNFVGK